MKKRPKIIVHVSLLEALSFLLVIREWCVHVTVIPELSNVSVFSRGMAVGFRVSMPSGGQFAPISIVGASLLWKKAQKKEKKKSTSDNKQEAKTIKWAELKYYYY